LFLTTRHLQEKKQRCERNCGVVSLHNGLVFQNTLVAEKTEQLFRVQNPQTKNKTGASAGVPDSNLQCCAAIPISLVVHKVLVSRSFEAACQAL
jgi:hypothetical protein